ncbi:MAG: 30S ribosomal protein S27e [Candidatus Thermoplasmatota archaeon]|jgi:small subunit ribosomal protein S27e|nr:30S ribosomal protein S27e [Candidatus Thermoplasmatota archaeon]MCL6091012.1 30S ribosomal protein S27e [Candidatus Thermoplasmatota archaeon]
MSEVSRFSKPKSIGNKFLKIKCKDCGNEQVTYTKISSVVVCNICGATLARPTGGTFDLGADIVGDTQ